LTNQDFTASSNIAIPNLPGSPETSVLSSPTGDATHVGEWANHTFTAIPSLNTIEEHEPYPSRISHPSGTLGPVGGIGEEVIIVAFGEKRHGIDLTDRIQEISVSATPTSSSSAQPLVTDPNSHPAHIFQNLSLTTNLMYVVRT
jgi:hypothetical protein